MDLPRLIVSNRPWIDIGPHPWRRYLARTVDTAFNATILAFVLGITFYSIDYAAAARFFAGLSQPHNRIWNAMVTCLLAIPGNGLLIGLTGGSVGKWLFGVRILDAHSQPIGIGRAFIREGIVWVRGLGLGIPILTIITSIVAYRLLAKTGATSWDQKMSLKATHRTNGPTQMALAVPGIALAIVALIGGLAAL